MDHPRRGKARGWARPRWVAAGRATAGLAALLSLGVAAGIRGDRSGASWRPHFAADGALLRPDGIERWVLVGTSTGLAYGPDRPVRGPGEFHAVFLEPRAYLSWREHGRFPDGTMLALVLRRPERPEPPGQEGWVAGEVLGVEVAVKDRARFPGGWAYYGFGRSMPGTPARPFPAERCARCHAGHAAVDNVFVQFYPLLREERPGAGRRLEPGP